LKILSPPPPESPLVPYVEIVDADVHLTFTQEAHGLHDAAGGLPELDVVKHAVGEVFTPHVGVGSTDDEAQRRVEVELVRRRIGVFVDQFTVDVQRQTGH